MLMWYFGVSSVCGFYLHVLFLLHPAQYEARVYLSDSCAVHHDKEMPDIPEVLTSRNFNC